MPSAVVPKSLLKPIPASQARSRAQEIVDANRDRVEDGIIGGGKRDLVRILVHAQKQIEARLEREIARRGDDTWTASDLQATLVQIRIALAQIEPKLTDLLARNAELAKELGAKSVVDLLRYFEQETGGGLRPLSIRPALALRHPMLERYATSVDRYGRAMIGTISRELQAGIVRGAPFHEMTDLLVGKRGPRGIVSMAAKQLESGTVVRTRQEVIQEGLFVRYRGWAERIVRTEGMRAYAEGAQAEMVEQRARNFPDLRRRLIETFDKRTGWDSYAAHGQVRGLHEPFTDGAGRVYLLPPGRPNDRAVVVPWRDTWEEPKAPAAKRRIVDMGARTPSTAPSPARPSPAPERFEEGKHAKRIDARGVAAADVQAMLRGAEDAKALGFLERYPLERLRIANDRSLPDDANGYWVADTIAVTTDRPPRTFGDVRPLGAFFSVSKTATTREEAFRRTFVHELGHHIHLAGGSEAADVERIVVEAHVRGEMGAISTYAKQDRYEYFAEAFAAYTYRRDDLRKHDPIAFRMVEDVLRKRGIPS